jgi:hypothetical protein
MLELNEKEGYSASQTNEPEGSYIPDLEPWA